jgi:hypothetical protein
MESGTREVTQQVSSQATTQAVLYHAWFLGSHSTAEPQFLYLSNEGDNCICEGHCRMFEKALEGMLCASLLCPPSSGPTAWYLSP